MPRPDRSAHRVFEARHREVDARLHRRFDEIADTLDLRPPLRTLFLSACERAAHLHSADCALANYEFRSGRSATAEDEIRREGFQEQEWSSSLTTLRRAADEARQAAEAEKAGESSAYRPYKVRYRPLASISKPLR